MAKNKGKPENLIPGNLRTPEEARELGRLGGIASGEARREKRKTSELLHDYIERKFGVTGKGLDGVLDQIFAEGGSPAISLLRLDVEANEPKKIEVDNNVTMADITRAMTKEQKLARLKDLTGKKD